MVKRTCLVLAVVAAASAGCGGSNGSSSGDPIVVHPASVYSVGSYDQLAATATVVVEAETIDVRRGPAIGDEGSQLGMNQATLRVTNWLKGKGDVELRVLFQGYEIESGREMVVEREQPTTVGEVALWFLVPTKVVEGTHYQLTSAGRVARGDDGRARTGGDEPPAAALCGVPWETARREIADAVASSSSVEPLQPFEEPPGYRDGSTNRCADAGSARATEEES